MRDSWVRVLCAIGVLFWSAHMTQARPTAPRVAMLVVSERGNTAMEARAQSIVNALVHLRDRAGLSEQVMPVLIYHYDLPAEGRYCQSKLKITSSDLLFVGVVEASQDIPSKVLYRIDHVNNDETAARVTWDQSRRLAGPSASHPASRSEIVLFSDTFNRADSDRCALGATDNRLGGRATFGYIPIFPGGGRDVSNPVGANIVGDALQNNGADFGGVQVSNSSGCELFQHFGVRQPQDLTLEADFQVPRSATGMSAAGLYARSRSANVGDGIIGGESSGYWVRLWSDGHVDVFNLHGGSSGPNPFVESASDPNFNPTAYHHLRADFQGDTLRVSLDQRRVSFRTGVVSLVPSAGANNGAAGIAFFSLPRGSAGGQRAKNLVVRARL